MNRRRFITVTATSLLAATFALKVGAQNDATQPRWDDASQLFGNAWELLGKAEEGTMVGVSTAFGDTDSLFGTQTALALIHNNSDTPLLPAAFAANASTGIRINGGTFFQELVMPGGYALAQLSYEGELDPTGTFPDLVLQALTEDEAKDRLAWEPYYTPLVIDDATIVGEGSITGMVSNATDADLRGSFPSGLVLWFDDEGAISAGTTITPSLNLGPGSEAEFESFISSPFDTTHAFLVGLFGYL